MRRAVVVCVVGLLAAGAQAGAELVLVDGRTLAGPDVRREGDLYLLEQDSGDVLTVPVALVEELRLTRAAPEPDPVTGTVRRDPQTLAGSSERPAGLVPAEPETLAGRPVRAASRSEQLAALGPPARFSKGVIENRWKPSSDWVNAPGAQNNFAPSSWSDNIVDNVWRPTNAFEGDELSRNRTTWRKGPIDPTWVPTDGFRRD